MENGSYQYGINVKDTKGSIKARNKELKTLADNIKRAAKHQKELNKLYAAQGFTKEQRGARAAIATGGLTAGNTNAAATGILNQHKAQTSAIRIQISEIKKAELAYKSYGTQAVLALSKIKRERLAALRPANSTQSGEILAAARLRVGAAKLGSDNDPTNRLRKVGLAQEEKILARIEQRHRKIVAHEKEQVRLSTRRIVAERKVAESVARAEVLKATGNRAEARKAILVGRTNQLLVIGNNTELKSAEIKKQQEIIQRKINRAKATEIRLAQQAKAANTPVGVKSSRRDPLDNLNAKLKDGGAGLFKIQAQLLANYAAMGAAIQSLRFASGFVVDLDKEFAQLQAITSTTDTNMQGLKKSIIEVSEATKFTALDVAQAATILGQAGFSLSQIESSLRPITLLATAVGTDLKTAVDLVTSTITVFNLRAEESGHIANVFTAAVNNSKLNLDKLTLGIQYSGNIANEQNITFTELTATLGAMANSGIRAGSTLGTGLRQILTALAAPTEKLSARFKDLGLTSDDTDVKLHGLVGVLDNLKEAGFTTSDALEFMQVRAGAAFAAMSNNSETISELRTTFLQTNAAMEANAIQMEALANRGSKLKSVFGTVAEKGAAPLVTVLKGLTDLITITLQLLNKMGPVLPILTTSLTALAVAFAANRAGIFLTGLATKKATVGLAEHTFATNVATGATARLTVAAKGLWKALGPIGVGILVLTGVTWGLNKAYDELTTSYDELEAATENSKGKTDEYTETLKSVNKEISILTQQQHGLADGSREANNAGLELTQKYKDLGVTFDVVNGKASTYIKTLQDLRTSTLELQSISLADTLDNIHRERDYLLSDKKGIFSRQGSLTNVLREGAFGKSKSVGGARAARVVNVNDLRPQEQKVLSALFTLIEGEGFTKDVQSFTGKGLVPEVEAALGDRFAELATERINASEEFLEQSQKEFDQLKINLGALSQITGFKALGEQNERNQIANAFERITKTQQTQLDSIRAAFSTNKAQIDDSENGLTPLEQARTSELRVANKELLLGLRDIINANDAQFSSDPNYKSSKLATTQRALYESIRTSVALKADEIKDIKDYNKEKSKEYAADLARLKGEVSDKSTVGKIRATQDKALAILDAKRILDRESERQVLISEGKSDGDLRLELAAKEKAALEIRAKTNKAYEDMLVPIVEKLLPAYKRAAEELDAQIKQNKANYQQSIRDAGTQYGSVEARNKTLRNRANRDEANFTLKIILDKALEEAALTKLRSEIEAGYAAIIANNETAARARGDAIDLQAQADVLQAKIDAFNAKDTEATRAAAKDSLKELEGFLKRVNAALEKAKLLDRESAALGDGIKEKELDISVATNEIDLPETDTRGEIGVGLQRFREELAATKADLEDYGKVAYDVAKTSQAALGDAFFDIITGASSVGDAFTGMATTIIKAMLKILAEKAAIFVIEQLFGFIGFSGFSNIGSTSAATSSGFSGRAPLKAGGPVPKHMARGGSTAFTPNRDTVPIIGEVGEYMLRKSAVDMIGVETLDRVNALGNRSISLGDQSQSMLQERPMQRGMGKSEVNVWVVEREPTQGLGENDVIAIIGKDIMSKGQTKSLIKSVSIGEI